MTNPPWKAPAGAPDTWTCGTSATRGDTTSSRGIHIQYTLDGAYAHLSYPEQVSLNTLRGTIAESKETLDKESPYGTDDLCTREDIARWTTMPDEYVEKR